VFHDSISVTQDCFTTSNQPDFLVTYFVIPMLGFPAFIGNAFHQYLRCFKSTCLLSVSGFSQLFATGLLFLITV
jgi:hypothetical protein